MPQSTLNSSTRIEVILANPVCFNKGRIIAISFPFDYQSNLWNWKCINIWESSNAIRENCCFTNDSCCFIVCGKDGRRWCWVEKDLSMNYWPTVTVDLCSTKSYAEVLTPSTSACDYIWRAVKEVIKLGQALIQSNWCPYKRKGHLRTQWEDSHSQGERSEWVKVTQSCLTVCNPMDYRNSPGQNTGVGSHSFLQGIFPTQGSNPGLPHCQWILYQLSHQEGPRVLEWVAYPFSSGSSWPRNSTGVSCIALQVDFLPAELPGKPKERGDTSKETQPADTLISVCSPQNCEKSVFIV